ncbi:MAG: hypothetical protein WD358_07710 [Nitriliruptoraceae bacterium]
MIRRTVALLALAVFATVGASTSASADSLGELLDVCDGIVVVIDPGTDDRDATVRCGPDADGNGLDALVGAGHQFTFVPGIPGMVCTIDEFPQACNGAPVDAYWSYWLGTPDGWAYSSAGAGFRSVDVNVIEGWAFGDGSMPPRWNLTDLTAPPTDTHSSSDAEPEQHQTPIAAIAGIALLAVIIAMTWWRSSRSAHTRPPQSDGNDSAAQPTEEGPQ